MEAFMEELEQGDGEEIEKTRRNIEESLSRDVEPVLLADPNPPEETMCVAAELIGFALRIGVSLPQGVRVWMRTRNERECEVLLDISCRTCEVYFGGVINYLTDVENVLSAFAIEAGVQAICTAVVYGPNSPKGVEFRQWMRWGRGMAEDFTVENVACHFSGADALTTWQATVVSLPTIEEIEVRKSFYDLSNRGLKCVH